LKLSVFIIIFILAQVICAQNNINKKLTHQLEYGINYVNFLQKNSRSLNGTGYFYNSGFNFTPNYYFGYKAIINEKHAIKLSIEKFISNSSYHDFPYLGIVGLSYYTLNLGYGYTFPFKVFSVFLGGQLSYRYAGGEAAVYGYRNPTSQLSEPVEAYLEYNSIGFSPNTEIEYSITKNFGLGVNLNLNYYPFENAKLKGDGTNEPDPMFVEIYKPNTLNFTTTFKLAYKFSFSKTKQ
jgi:hypothetical protein